MEFILDSLVLVLMLWVLLLVLWGLVGGVVILLAIIIMPKHEGQLLTVYITVLQFIVPFKNFKS